MGETGREEWGQTNLEISEERVHKEIKYDKWCKDGVQYSHKNESPPQPYPTKVSLKIPKL